MEQEIEFVPDRLNEEPVILMGMTDSELKTIGLTCILGWVFTAMLLAAPFAMVMYGAVCGALLGIGTTYLIGKQLRILKRGRPKQYHVMVINGWLEDNGLKNKTMIRASHAWAIHKTGPNESVLRREQ